MFSFYWLGFKKILGVLKKVLIVFVVFFAVINLFFYFITQNQITISNDPLKRNQETIYQVINDPKLNETREGKLTISLYRLFFCTLIGEGCSDNIKDGEKNFKSSVLGFVSNLITIPYANPPASGVYWAYSGLQKSGFIPKAYAAEGLGFGAIRPLLNVWKLFRDISYMILVIILIAIGFMIMFRMKLNPQTVISVENALPKIVIALLLITFSFAIAGFLIDLMYLTIILSISLLSNRDQFYTASEFIDKYTDANYGDLFFLLWPGGAKKGFGGFGVLYNLGISIINILPSFINQILRALLGGVAVYYLSMWGPIHSIYTSIPESIGKSAEGGSGGILGKIELILHTLAGIVSLITKVSFAGLVIVIIFLLGYGALPFLLTILIFFTIIFLLFRIFFLLFSTYLKILLMIIFSPIILLFEAFPGKSTFGWWFKNLVAELLTFPLVIIILITGYLLYSATPATRIVNLWQPPFLSDMRPDAFITLVAIGFILLIPDLVKMVKELMGAKGMPISLSLGTFFGGVGMALGGVQGIAGMGSSLTQMPFIGTWLQKQAWTPTGQANSQSIFGRLARGFTPPPMSGQLYTALNEAGLVKPKTSP